MLCNLGQKALCLVSFLFSFLAFSGVYADAKLAQRIAEADIGYGEYLAGECVICHKGKSAGSIIPIIAGINAKYFIDKINAYRNKKLKNTVMQMVSKRLDE